MNETHNLDAPSCPVPALGAGDAVLLAHGEGGRLSNRLLRERILPRLSRTGSIELHDAAALANVDGRLVFTTDSYVVTPLFFPGGDIGTLAVCGTLNDLAVAGAAPLWLSLAMIVEEGLPLATLDRVLERAARAAHAEGVEIVTGDTKVVPRGAADGLFLTTAGIGKLIAPAPPGPALIEAGDAILVTGPLASHGIAVLAARENLALHPAPQSDVAPLLAAVDALRRARIPVRAMRDATRGGVAAVLHEWADACGKTFAIDESALTVRPEVRGACELLGLDPLYIANEAVMVAAVPPSSSDAAVRALRDVPVSAHAAFVGNVREREVVPVVVRRVSGRELPLDLPIAAHLPRIC